MYLVSIYEKVFVKFTSVDLGKNYVHIILNKRQVFLSNHVRMGSDHSFGCDVRHSNTSCSNEDLVEDLVGDLMKI